MLIVGGESSHVFPETRALLPAAADYVAEIPVGRRSQHAYRRGDGERISILTEEAV